MKTIKMDSKRQIEIKSVVDSDFTDREYFIFFCGHAIGTMESIAEEGDIRKALTASFKIEEVFKRLFNIDDEKELIDALKEFTDAYIESLTPFVREIEIDANIKLKEEEIKRLTTLRNSPAKTDNDDDDDCCCSSGSMSSCQEPHGYAKGVRLDGKQIRPDGNTDIYR